MKNKKVITISILAILLLTIIVTASKPTPNTENQYYILGDNSEAVPQLGFNWSDNETYLYPFNETIWYRNETGSTFDLTLTDGAGGADGYAGDMGHPHDQDLNESDVVIFEGIIYNADGDNFVIDAGDNDLSLDINFAKPALLIDSTGELTMPYQSASRAYIDTAYSQGSGWHIVHFNTENFDQNNDYNVGPYRFSIPIDGLYLVTYVVYATGFLINDVLYGVIKKNDVSYGGYTKIRATTNGEGLVVGACDIVQCVATDYINIYATWTGVGISRLFHGDASDDSYFAVHKLS